VTVTVETEHRVLAMALAWPTRGTRWVSQQLAEQQLAVPATTVWRILRRHGLSRREARLAAVEYQAAAVSGVVTERVRRRVARRCAVARHVLCGPAEGRRQGLADHRL